MRGSKIGYSKANSVLKSSMSLICFDTDFVKKFGLQSFRVGPTLAAHGWGELSLLEIQTSGMWNSSETPKSYNVAAEQEMCKL